MTTAVSATLTYPADVQTVLGMLGDADFLRAKCEARGERDVTVLESAYVGDTLRVVTRRTVDVAVPAFAARFVHPTNSVTQTDVWYLAGARAHTGEWQVDAKGVPTKMSGTMRLTSRGDVTVEAVEGTIKSSVPLVGGRVEAFVRDALLSTLAHEEGFASSWLVRPSH